MLPSLLMAIVAVVALAPTGVAAPGVFAVDLPNPFGAAEAKAIEASDRLVLEVRVEVAGGAVAVLARPVGLAGEGPPTALSHQGDGLWAGIVELPAVENVKLGFEAIRPGGTVDISPTRTLVELGVDPAVFREPSPPTSLTTTTSDPRFTPDAARWGWLAVAAGAAGLLLLLLWATGGSSPEGGADSGAADGPGTDAAGGDDEEAEK